MSVKQRVREKIIKFIEKISLYTGIRYQAEFTGSNCYITLKGEKIRKIDTTPPYLIFPIASKVCIGAIDSVSEGREIYNKDGIPLKYIVKDRIVKIKYSSKNMYTYPVPRDDRTGSNLFELPQDIILILLQLLRSNTNFDNRNERGDIAALFLTCKSAIRVIDNLWKVMILQENNYYKKLFCGFRLYELKNNILSQQKNGIQCLGQIEGHIFAIDVNGKFIDVSHRFNAFNLHELSVRTSSIVLRVCYWNNNIFILFLDGKCEKFNSAEPSADNRNMYSFIPTSVVVAEDVIDITVCSKSLALLKRKEIHIISKEIYNEIGILIPDSIITYHSNLKRIAFDNKNVLFGITFTELISFSYDNEQIVKIYSKEEELINIASNLLIMQTQIFGLPARDRILQNIHSIFDIIGNKILL